MLNNRKLFMKWLLAIVLVLSSSFMQCHITVAQTTVTNEQVWEQTRIAYAAYQNYRIAEDDRMRIESLMQLNLNQSNACKQLALAYCEAYDERGLEYQLWADILMNRYLALKVLLPNSLAVEKQLRERFIAEGLKLDQMLAAQRIN